MWFIKKAVNPKQFFRVRCDGWLYANHTSHLSEKISEAYHFDTLENAMVVAKKFNSNERFTIIENNKGKVTFHDVKENNLDTL